MEKLKIELLKFWEKIKQWPLYILLSLSSLWLIFPFAFWMLRGEAVKNLDVLIVELDQKQNDIKQTQAALAGYKKNQAIELTSAQKESLSRLARHDENTILQLFSFLIKEVPLYLFFIILGILIEERFHLTNRLKQTKKSSPPKIKIFAPQAPSSSLPENEQEEVAAAEENQEEISEPLEQEETSFEEENKN